MKSDAITSWIVAWFEKNTARKRREIENGMRDNYLDNGWLDSLAFISFITDAEKKFGISFSSTELQDRTFATIEGVSRIIKSKVDEKK